MEKVVNVEWEGKQVELKLKSLTYGEYKKIRNKSIIIKNVEGKKLEFRDLELYDILFLLQSIVEAPFELIQKNIEKLSIKDGQKLEKVVDELNFPKE